MTPHANTTTFPQNKLNSSRWVKRHQGILSLHKQNNASPDVILMGDSIMQQWEQAGSKVLQHWSRKLIIHNLGFAGDKIQHALWRVLNGQLDNITPRLLLLNIGTNNVFDNTAEEIAAGVQYLVHQIQCKLPDTQIMVYRLFPRGKKDSIERQIGTEASRLYSSLTANSLIDYIDINLVFSDHQDVIPLDIMHDQLHLTPKGYSLWLNQLQPYFEQCIQYQSR
ncbi:GDSL-type esterase/lipase family protein [uncultured Shewanella sp.]|uniref:GDSL-type esterase/lipase family protein n=1 Tax=uncultured Shewanella sp. TaxID=173975 RepID=UPI0026107F46|nr:GDSL-type esterase/lipase family protein [uncultured Shewanella sp.]